MGFRFSWPGQLCLLVAILAAHCRPGQCTPSPWPLWGAYQARFIDSQGRVIDHTTGDRTTSEGQAYAMFFALANNDRGAFDRLLAWTQSNMAGGDLHARLPGWLWGHAGDGQWKSLDPNPASDADIWMAYTLLEAGRLWQDPTYSNLSRAMMKRIAASEVINLPGFGPMLMPGPEGFHRDRTWTVNPSYVPVFIMQRFAEADPKGPWRKIAAAVPRLLERSSRQGFAMDWVTYSQGVGFKPASAMQTGNPDSNVAGGSYDAIRVYLWAGMMDGSGPLRGQLLRTIAAMGDYLQNHPAPPERVNENGFPLPGDGPVGFSAAMLPYLQSLPNRTRENAQQLARLEGARDAATGLFGKDSAYYDQNLSLFSTGFIEGRFGFGRGGELTVQWER